MPIPYLIALALLLGWSVAVADDHLERCASLSKITIPATQDTVHFYQGQVRRHGEKRVSDAVAFYLVPGQAHGHGSFRATGSMPLLPVLEKWVSKGVAPGTLTATDTNKKSQGRTRPMCRYPSWPKYDGKGDVNSAENFSCVSSL